MNTLVRTNLIRQARYSIEDGDAELEHGKPSKARAHYARASVHIQLAGYLVMTEEEADRKATLEAIRGPAPFVVPAPPVGMTPEEIERRLGPDAGRA